MVLVLKGTCWELREKAPHAMELQCNDARISGFIHRCSSVAATT